MHLKKDAIIDEEKVMKLVEDMGKAMNKDCKSLICNIRGQCVIIDNETVKVCQKFVCPSENIRGSFEAIGYYLCQMYSIALRLEKDRIEWIGLGYYLEDLQKDLVEYKKER